MIILGVGVSVLAVVVVGLVVARKVGGDSTNYLVAGRGLAVPVVGAALMGKVVDSNATLGNTDLAAQFGFWAGSRCHWASRCACCSPACSSRS